MLRTVKGRLVSRSALAAVVSAGVASPAFATGGTLTPVQSTLQNARHDPDRSHCDFARNPRGDRARLLRLVRPTDLGPRSLRHFSESFWCSGRRKS